jgi:hypothetical protein
MRNTVLDTELIIESSRNFFSVSIFMRSSSLVKSFCSIPIIYIFLGGREKC